MATSTAQALATIPVYDYLIAPSGAALPGKKVTVTLTYSLSQSASPVTLLGTDPVVTQTDPNGFWQVNLVPNNKVSPSGTLFKVEIEGYRSYMINVTDVAAPAIGWQSSAIAVLPPVGGGAPGYTLPGGTSVLGGLTIAPGETGLDTNSAGALVLGDNVATSIELGTSTLAAKDFRRSFQSITEAVLVSGIDPTAGEIVAVTLTANRVVGLPLNPQTGQRIELLITQNATGGWTLTWPGGIPTAWQPVPTANSTTTLAIEFDGTNWQAVAGQVPVSNLGVLSFPGPIVAQSFTAKSSSPYAQKALAGTVDAALGIFDWGGESFNAKSQNNPAGAAKGDGVTNDNAALQGMATAVRAANASGLTGATGLLPPGVFLQTSTLAMDQGRMRILGAGQASILRVNGAMANGQINVSNNQCTIESLLLDGASSTASANPAADGIQISGAAVGTRILNISAFYTNGWVINFLASCTGYQVYIDNFYCRQTLNGITFDGTAAPTLSVGAMITNAFPDTVASGDAWYFHNAHDVVMGTTFGSCATAGTGHALHLKGSCAAIQVTGSDFYGPTLANRYCLMVEADGGNIPKEITIGTTILAGGDFAAVVTSGQGIVIYGTIFALNRQGSIYCTGAAGDALTVTGCTSHNNNVGAVGGTAELSVQSLSNKVSGANWTFLAGTNAIPVLSIAAGANNVRLTGCPGFNPAGSGSTTPGFPATTVGQRNNAAVDVVAYITNGVNALTVQIDGLAAAMIIPASAVASVVIPAGSTFTPTYAGGAPTWKWYGL